MNKPKVYFCRIISQEKMLELYKLIEKELPNGVLQGNVAVKVHSGEKGNQNYLHPDFFENIINYVNGTVVECNTAYGGERNTSEKHLALLNEHNWTRYFKVDLLDEEDDDLEILIPNGKVIKNNYLGKNIRNYDSMLVLSHFKGHPMGGYGGAIKQLSIGCASSRGKSWIHSGGYTKDQYILWEHCAPQNVFLEAMADAAFSVVEYFEGDVAYINVMANMSVDCDCCSVAEDPCIKDIGILASIDPVAIDKACIDLVKESNDPGKEHFLERVQTRNGEHTIEAAKEIGLGSIEYELIEIK